MHNEAVLAAWRWSVLVLSIASNHQNSSLCSPSIPEARQCKPNLSFTKLNVDAIFFLDEGVGATTAVLRDDRGNFLVAQYKFISFAADVIIVEVMTMRNGLALANSLRARKEEGKEMRDNNKGKERN